jgi:hypothetical protein
MKSNEYYAITVKAGHVTRGIGRAYSTAQGWRYGLDAGYTWLGHRTGSIGEPSDGDCIDVDGPEGRTLATLKRVNPAMDRKGFMRRLVR